MNYIVKRIDEDLDFGCEEHAEGAPVMAVVTLVDEEGRELKMKQPDGMLYEKGIERGDSVKIGEDGMLEKG